MAYLQGQWWGRDWRSAWDTELLSLVTSLVAGWDLPTDWMCGRVQHFTFRWRVIWSQQKIETWCFFKPLQSWEYAEWLHVTFVLLNFDEFGIIIDFCNSYREGTHYFHGLTWPREAYFIDPALLAAEAPREALAAGAFAGPSDPDEPLVIERWWCHEIYPHGVCWSGHPPLHYKPWNPPRGMWKKLQEVYEVGMIYSIDAGVPHWVWFMIASSWDMELHLSVLALKNLDAVANMS